MAVFSQPNTETPSASVYQSRPFLPLCCVLSMCALFFQPEFNVCMFVLLLLICFAWLVKLKALVIVLACEYVCVWWGGLKQARLGAMTILLFTQRLCNLIFEWFVLEHCNQFFSVFLFSHSLHKLLYKIYKLIETFIFDI